MRNFFRILFVSSAVLGSSTLPSIALAQAEECQYGWSHCIDNGLAPPIPSNVIDASNSFSDVFVLIYDTPPNYLPFPGPNMPTSIAIVDGGFASYGIRAYDSSTVTMTGGLIHSLSGNVLTRIDMSGGEVEYELTCGGACTITGGIIGYQLYVSTGVAQMSGGSVVPYQAGGYEETGHLIAGYGSSASAEVYLNGGTLEGHFISFHDSVITIEGSGFAVDGEPVPLGVLDYDTGVLTGTLESGDPLNNVFYINDSLAPPPFVSSQPTGGSIVLVPEPTSWPMLAAGVAFLGLLYRRRARGFRLD